ncbi:MAG: aromatic ring-hydroxylating dioxygenase subunit alpha [Acidimicrobiales bacterium]|nr:aromatic ring-hydroxylating dioxygenase subunit alpha [Acidimicrobiales bacterium]
MGNSDATGFSSHPAIRRYWHPVARSAAITGAVGVQICGEQLVLWRDPDGVVVAAPDRCPHREAPLSCGVVTLDGEIECPYHGWRFGSGGRCVAVPSSDPGVPVPPKAHLPTVACAERYGLVWVCLDEPIADIPRIPQDDDPAFRRINNPVERWDTCAMRMTDNFVDITHFPFVHTATFGIRQETTVPKVELEALDDDWFGYQYEVNVRNEAAALLASGQAEAVLHRHMSSGFSLPFLVRSTIRYETGLEHILLLCSTPIDDVTSYFTFVVWRNDDFSVSAEDVIVFDRAIGAEDKAMLEKVPGVLPLDQTATVSVQADKCSVEWRRRFAALLTSDNPAPAHRNGGLVPD